MLREAGGGGLGKTGKTGAEATEDEEEEVEALEEEEEERDLRAARAAFSFSSISFSDPMIDRKVGRASGSSAQHEVMSVRHAGGVAMGRGGRYPACAARCAIFSGFMSCWGSSPVKTSHRIIP